MKVNIPAYPVEVGHQRCDGVLHFANDCAVLVAGLDHIPRHLAIPDHAHEVFGHLDCGDHEG
eukprot:2187754-Pyramimonas_sp.AAC.1